VFVQTDDTAGNRVVAYQRAADGTLTPAGSYPTGGRGGILAGSVVDHTASQGSLTCDPRHGLRYAVNADSDTISVFAVGGDRLVLRQVLGSGGTFPVSVAGHRLPRGHCTEYLAQMRETIRLTGRLEPEDLTPQMREEFTDLYRRWRSEQQ